MSQKTPKLPKPPTTPPRTQTFTLHLTEEERAQLDAAAFELGVSRGDVLRGAFRNYPRVSRRS